MHSGGASAAPLAHPAAGDARARHDALTYRPDIDGLRAIAIMAVVLYHAFPARWRGGFIGVDIFFVISGFLVSGALFKRLAGGSFGWPDIRDFYARRVKRIFPALCLMLAACYVAGWFILTPGEYLEFAKEALAGAAFVSNFYFWFQTGYFDGAADAKPLLHLWSLAIEEQFYLAWPLLLYGTWRLRARPLFVISLLGALSFGYGIHLVGVDRTAAFYSPLTRFWELMVGGLLAWLVHSGPPAFLRRHQQARSLAGLALLAAGLWLTTDRSAFPGWYALLPVLGAALLISAPGSWLNHHAIGCGPMRAIGLISYPLYLWHWPVLYLVRYFDLFRPAGEQGARWAAVALSIALSALTYAVVEKPIRFGRLKRHATAPLLGFMLAMAGVGIVTLHANGFSDRDSGELGRLARFAGKYPATEWRDRSCFLSPADGAEKFAPECEGARGRGPLVYLWGDSYAAALYPGLKQLEDQGTFRLAQYTASACPPLLGSSFPAQAHCTAINEFVLRRIALDRPHTVLLSARWPYREVEPGYDFKHLEATVAELRKIGVQQVIVIGPTPQWDKPMPSLLGRCESQQVLEGGSRFSRCGLVPDTDALDRAMQAFVTGLGAAYVSAYDALCNRHGCLTVLDDGAVSTYDLGHLSPEASRLLMTSLAGRLLPP